MNIFINILCSGKEEVEYEQTYPIFYKEFYLRNRHTSGFLPFYGEVSI